MKQKAKINTILYLPFATQFSRHPYCKQTTATSKLYQSHYTSSARYLQTRTKFLEHNHMCTLKDRLVLFISVKYIDISSNSFYLTTYTHCTSKEVE